MGNTGEGAITLKTTVYSGEASDTSPRELDDITLGPGGFHQYSGLLGGLENGYVKVERVEGEAPFYAYGGDQRPGQLGRVVRHSGEGPFPGGEEGSDPAGDRGDQGLHQRADGDELLRRAEDTEPGVCVGADPGRRQEGGVQHGSGSRRAGDRA